jgi:hypothetical protein
MSIPTRAIYVSTKNVRTDGLPGDTQNDVEGSYTLTTKTDYGVWEPEQDLSNSVIERRAALVKVVRTGDQRS